MPFSAYVSQDRRIISERAARPWTPSNIPVTHTDAEWRKLLTPEQFDIMREHGTERPGSCALNSREARRHVLLRRLRAAAVRVKQKFESGTGWPSFNDPVAGRGRDHDDRSYGMVRTEVHCSRCGSHLGHVFEDGPPPTASALLHQRRGDELQAGLRPCVVQANDGARVAFRRGRGSARSARCHEIATSLRQIMPHCCTINQLPALLNLLDTCPIIAE